MSQFDRDANDFNRKYAIRAIALGVLRQDTSLTMLEATLKAEAIYNHMQQR